MGYKEDVYSKWLNLNKQGKIFEMSVEEGIIVHEMHAAAQKKDRELEKRRRRVNNEVKRFDRLMKGDY